MRDFKIGDRVRIVNDTTNTVYSIVGYRTGTDRDTPRGYYVGDFVNPIPGNMLISVDDRGIKNVIFNPPATIVFWEDGTKTVVKCDPRDVYNPEIGLLLCIAKKYFGNNGRYYSIIRYYEKKFITDNIDTFKGVLEKISRFFGGK